MLYAARWPADGFVKFGWAANAEQRLSDGFADVSHPNPQLCGGLPREGLCIGLPAPFRAGG